MANFSTNYKSVFDELMAHCRAPHHHISLGFKVHVYSDRVTMVCVYMLRGVYLSASCTSRGM